jgi:hypothetical protein
MRGGAVTDQAVHGTLPMWPVWIAVGLFAVFVGLVIWNTFFHERAVLEAEKEKRENR